MCVSERTFKSCQLAEMGSPLMTALNLDLAHTPHQASACISILGTCTTLISSQEARLTRKRNTEHGEIAYIRSQEKKALLEHAAHCKRCNQLIGMLMTMTAVSRHLAMTTTCSDIASSKTGFQGRRQPVTTVRIQVETPQHGLMLMPKQMSQLSSHTWCFGIIDERIWWPPGR